MNRLHWQMAVLMVCVMSATLSGKGPTTRIVIAALSLTSPIDITDPDVLRGVVIWSGAGVLYEPDPARGQGYVYFPGKGEESYALNVSSIYRGREGHWFRATRAWNQAAVKAIAGKPAQPAPE